MPIAQRIKNVLAGLTRGSRDSPQSNVVVPPPAPTSEGDFTLTSENLETLFDMPSGVTTESRKVHLELVKTATPKLVGCLELVSSGLMIGATDGSETIASSIDVFYSTHPSGVSVVGQPTMKTIVNLYKKVGDGSLVGIFGNFHASESKLSVEWGQIVSFMRAREHQELLTEEDFILFLMPFGGAFVVVSVYRNSRGGRFTARFCEMSEDNISQILGTIYVVVPKLK